MITNIKISGLHCASCKALIEDVARDVAGIVSCDVDPAAGQARVEHDSQESLAALIGEIASLGDYEAKVI